MQAFIGRTEMAWIATADSAGHCDCSFRSGPPGFVRVLGEGLLAYPDYRGNGGHPGRRPTHWVAVSVEEAYVHCRKHLPRLVRQPSARHWGTDSRLAKGGDYFGVAAGRSAEFCEISA
jgi:uncharacterized protein